MWDAMGYNSGIRYNKHTGQLIGFAEDFQFGLCVQRFANKVHMPLLLHMSLLILSTCHLFVRVTVCVVWQVNVLSVISPQEGIEINFPVAHHHVNVLNRLSNVHVMIELQTRINY
jgi:hypothetical protein